MKNVIYVASALLLCASANAAAPFLLVDVNDRTVSDTPNNVPGYTTLMLLGSTATHTAPISTNLGSYSVTLAPFDDHQDQNTANGVMDDTAAAIDDRDRSTPANSGSLTFGQIYDDFIFAGASAGPTGGMDLSVSGGSLLPSTQYLISIYAYDSGSTPVPQPRRANWLDGNNSDAVVLTTSFDGTVLPTTDDTYKFTGIAWTDANGVLLLKGRNLTGYQPDGAVSPGVFLNGFEIGVVPEPSALTLLLGAGLLAFLRRR